MQQGKWTVRLAIHFPSLTLSPVKKFSNYKLSAALWCFVAASVELDNVTVTQ
jgi:hypothetical protein